MTLEYWSDGVSECWGIGVLECWSIGVLEYWSIDHEYIFSLPITPSLHFSKHNFFPAILSSPRIPGFRKLFFTHYSISPSLHFSKHNFPLNPFISPNSWILKSVLYPLLHFSITPFLQSVFYPSTFSSPRTPGFWKLFFTHYSISPSLHFSKHNFPLNPFISPNSWILKSVLYPLLHFSITPFLQSVFYPSTFSSPRTPGFWKLFFTHYSSTPILQSVFYPSILSSPRIPGFWKLFFTHYSSTPILQSVFYPSILSSPRTPGF